jgi:hypothetical protein
MPTAVCPQCQSRIPFLPEQAGQPGMCPSCHAEVEFKQSRLVTAGAIASTILGVVSTIVLGFFGCLGGINALFGHGILMFIFLMLAVLSGMRIRTVLIIFAVYFALVLVLSIEWTNKPGKKKTRASQTVAAPLCESAVPRRHAVV